ncbi:MAG: hypothetical protein GXY50_04670 [Syntrophomonadaceae bacterium]|nr:hypothetical protein [Syntrophomonadaceae bacterium]
MPEKTEELEQNKTTDPAETTGEQTPAREDSDASESTPEPVQAGNLSENDRSNLLEDPTAGTGTSGGAQPDQQSEAPSGNNQAAENAPGPPASTPSPDKYALLKRDVSSLTEEEKAERAKLIIEKYITDWKTKKEERMKELTEGMSDDEKSKEETRKSDPVPSKSRGERFLEGVDTVKEWGDLGADIAGDAASFATDVADTAHTSQGNDNHQATSVAGNIASIATGGWGTLSGGYGMFRSGQNARQKRKKGDSRGAALSRFDVASNLFGTASGATGMASGITGLTGSDASDWLGHASGIAGIGGSVTDMIKGIYQKRSYSNLANRKETVDSKAKMANQYMRSTDNYKQMKESYNKGDQSAHSKEKRMEMLKQRHDHKRSKDFMGAMASAQEHSKIKSQAGGSGILSGALNALSGGMGLAGGFAKQFGGFGGKIAGTVLGGISSLTKYATKYFVNKKGEDKEKAAKKAANDTKGKEYIEEKAANLKKKADAQADHITDEEAKLIVAKRLGIDDPSDYAEVYKKLSERRADRILNKEEGYKEILAAMGLTEDADKATIMEALGVS